MNREHYGWLHLGNVYVCTDVIKWGARTCSLTLGFNIRQWAVEKSALDS